MQIRIIGLLLITFSLFLSVFGQTQNLILSLEQNNKWLDTVKTPPLDKQLLTISDRLLSDTNVFVRQYYADRIKVVDSLGNRIYGDGKPTLIIGGHPMIIDNKTQTFKIISLTKLLTDTYIKGLVILSPNDPPTAALYGSPGQFGIIIMTVTKKKYAKLFNQLELKSNY